MKKLTLASLIALNVAAGAVPLLPLFIGSVVLWKQFASNEYRLELPLATTHGTDDRNSLRQAFIKDHYLQTSFTLPDDNGRFGRKYYSGQQVGSTIHAAKSYNSNQSSGIRWIVSNP